MEQRSNPAEPAVARLGPSDDEGRATAPVVVPPCSWPHIFEGPGVEGPSARFLDVLLHMPFVIVYYI